jgi:hypothetical protein
MQSHHFGYITQFSSMQTFFLNNFCKLVCGCLWENNFIYHVYIFKFFVLRGALITRPGFVDLKDCVILAFYCIKHV